MSVVNAAGSLPDATRITSSPAAAAAAQPARTAMGILCAISLAHLLNDTIQSLISSIYPLLKSDYHLDFKQIGLITLAFQCTASLFQPIVGIVTDRKPMPFSLVVGMGASLVGLVLLSLASSYGIILLAASLVGVGSSIFHPESSRVARMASGGRLGFAQALFQVGGNSGQALGPLLAAFIVVPFGQGSILWFSGIALVGMLVLARVGVWYRAQVVLMKGRASVAAAVAGLSRLHIWGAFSVLVVLTVSKTFYIAGFTSYYTFFLIDKFAITTRESQYFLFLFMASSAAGTFVGGPLGDRFGRKIVLWVSILGVLPFSLALPYVDLFWTGVLSAIIGFIVSSSFSAIVVFAQELAPTRVGMVAGIFFGLSFGLGGIGAAALGQLADATSIGFVFKLCSILPAFGILAAFLPNMARLRR